MTGFDAGHHTHDMTKRMSRKETQGYERQTNMKIDFQLKRAIRAAIEDEVKAGFKTPAEIIEWAVDIFSDDAHAQALRPLVEQLTATAIAQHLKAQAEWPDVTDNDRLDAAFAELEEQYGILARQNYRDCVVCADNELQDEGARAREQGRMIRGYTFYDMQETYWVIENGTLSLSFGILEADEDLRRAMHKVAKNVVKVLERHGLDVTWAGQSYEPIEIQMDWKRRR